MSLISKLIMKTRTWRNLKQAYDQNAAYCYELGHERDNLVSAFNATLTSMLKAGHPVYYAGNYFVYRDNIVLYLKTWEKIKHLRKKARIEKAVLLDKDTHVELNCPPRISQTFIKD